MMNMQSRKYGRTYHYPFSPGTTSDDRINSDWWAHIQNIEQLVHTEKLDGENNCLSRYGVFGSFPWRAKHNPHGLNRFVNVGN
ncbi:Uncharacterised protein [Providencia rustigianii]|nr:Uncharacterised protein [Providencia rustigianii]